MPMRKEWFLERVGKIVYRIKSSCNCGMCNEVYEKGLKIIDKEHADYLYTVEGDYNAAGVNFKYFDTIKERDEFEKK